MIIRFITYIIIFVATDAQAKIATPVFADFWYKIATVKLQDSCSMTHFVYDEKFNDAKIAANLYLKNVQKYEDCTWNDAHLFMTYQDLPPDFIGGYNEWEKMSKIESMPKPQRWQRECVNSEGFYKDEAYVVLYPSYTCPNGTNYSFDLDDKRFGCSDKPSPCIGDIVGRDLGGVIPFPGHIGLVVFPLYPAWDNIPRVMEVLNETDNVIQRNTIEDFKSRTKFWGTKFGLKDAPVLEYMNAMLISKAAHDQRNCGEITYTPDWNWYPCQYDSMRGKRTAMFRCDSFVYNAYLQGANIKIVPNFIPPVMPRTIFSNFLSFRFGMASLNKSINDEKYFSSISANVNEFNVKNEIDSIFSKRMLSLVDADDKTHKFVTSELPRNNKISFLWATAKNYSVDTLKFSYLMGCLEYLYPIELTNEILEEFDKQRNLENKIVLLRVLANLTSDQAKLLYNKYNINTKPINKIIKFYKNIMLHANSVELIEKAISWYPLMVSPIEAKIDIDAAIARNDIDSFKLKKKLYEKPSYFTQQLSLIFSTQEMQRKYLLELINSIQSSENNVKNTFINSLYYFFKDEDYTPVKIGFNPELIDDNVRQPMLTFLDSIRSISMNEPDDLFGANKYYWISTYSAFQSHSRKEKNSRIAHIIKSSKDSNYISSLFINTTKSVYDQFTIRDLQAILISIEKENLMTSKALTQTQRNRLDIDKHTIKSAAISKIKSIMSAKNL